MLFKLCFFFQRSEKRVLRRRAAIARDFAQPPNWRFTALIRAADGHRIAQNTETKGMRVVVKICASAEVCSRATLDVSCCGPFLMRWAMSTHWKRQLPSQIPRRILIWVPTHYIFHSQRENACALRLDTSILKISMLTEFLWKVVMFCKVLNRCFTCIWMKNTLPI